MIELIWDLVPVVLGVVASPLAIMALVAVLLSRRAQINGVLYLAGWVAAIGIALAGSYAVLGALELDAHRDPPAWVAFARLILAAALFSSAVWIYRSSHAKVMQMATASSPEDIAEAAPQLPGWLQAVEHFSPMRSFALGLGIFLLNPVNVSCAVVAAIDVRLADLASAPSVWVLVGFAIVGMLPVAIPVALVMLKGARAEPALSALRQWIASHTGILNVVLLVLVAFMQVRKALPELS